MVKPLRAFRRLGGSLSHGADLLLPPTCFACGIDLRSQPSSIGACRDCWDELRLIEGPACPRCGAPAVVVGEDQALPCGHCRDAKWRFDGAIAAGVYEGLLRHLTLRAKRAAEESVALALGELVWQAAGDRLRGESIDAVTVVPMHWRRRLVRQTNSPELMGEVLARRLGAPFVPRLLKRIRATAAQPSVARSQRLPNVRAAFAARPGHRCDGGTILLVDDILTTGATCSEAARAIKAVGGDRVVVVVAARSL